LTTAPPLAVSSDGYVTRRPLLKICGLRDPAQAAAVAALGADAIGVIAVAASPRYLASERRPDLFAAVRQAAPGCLGVLVVADPSDAELEQLGPAGGHQVLQLHGAETPERCREIRRRCGGGLWKAVRLRQSSDLEALAAYAPVVDALLLDAWVPDQLGGTGHRIPLEWLESWRAPLPWWLAGGMAPERVGAVLERLRPDGIDASSGVERAPGDKDLDRVAALVAAVGGVGQDQAS
jgi:phosphoribosylanthranilate isomerase